MPKRRQISSRHPKLPLWARPWKESEGQPGWSSVRLSMDKDSDLLVRGLGAVVHLWIVVDKLLEEQTRFQDPEGIETPRHDPGGVDGG